MDDIDLDHVTLFRNELAKSMAERHPKLRQELRNGKIDDAMSERLKRHIANFKERFLKEHPNKSTMVDVAKAAEETGTLDPTSDDSEQER